MPVVLVLAALAVLPVYQMATCGISAFVLNPFVSMWGMCIMGLLILLRS